MPYPYPGLFAIDPQDTSNVASNAELTIFDPADSTRAPIPLTDSEGLSIPNPLETNDKGFIGVFYSELDEVGWQASGLVGLLQSYQGIKAQAQAAAERSDQAAIDAATSAANSEVSRIAAEKAANMVGTPADAAVAAMFNNETETQLVADARYSKRGEFFINALDYGLKDGEDNDDAWAAIFAAGAAFGPKTIIVPEGTFYAKHAPRLPSGVTIQGAGRGKTFFAKRAGKTATSYFSILSQGSTGYGSGAQNVTIRGVTFKGDFANLITAGALGANHGSNVRFEDCDFDECQGTSHIADLGGCDGVYFTDCRFRGALYQSMSNAYNEAIQLDNSTRGGSSVSDAPGSYDGLPTKNVVLTRCQFLPLTVNGVEYPAPTPIGAHAGVEGYWQQNITLRQCIIDTPGEDTASAYRGILHFLSCDGILLDDVWIFNRNHVAVRGFSTQALGSSIYAADADVSGAPTHSLSAPQMTKNIHLRKVRFVGFSHPGVDEPIVRLRGSTATSRISNIVLEDVEFIDCHPGDTTGATGAHQIEIAFADNVKIVRGGSNGSRRYVYYATVSNLTIDGAKAVNSSKVGCINGISANGLKILNMEIDGYSLAIYDQGGIDVEIRGMRLRNARADTVYAIDLNGGSRFKLIGNDGNGPVGVGVNVRGNRTGGTAFGNDMTGFATPYAVAAGSSMQVAANLPV